MLAIGIIPVENIDHISWFLQLCALHGIDLNCALFTDRGPLLSAARYLHESTTLKLSLMFCLEHVKRNICHKFDEIKKEDSKKSVKKMIGVEVYPLLATDDVDTFLSNLLQKTNLVKIDQESSAAAKSHRQNKKKATIIERQHRTNSNSDAKSKLMLFHDMP